MSNYQTILFVIGDDGAARLTLNRPDEHNLMTPTMMREVQDALTRVHRDRALRVLVLGANGKTFCPGIGHEKGSGKIPKRVAVIPIDASIPRLLYTAPIPTIAAINGACAGVGLGLACACDLRVCTPTAIFRSAFLSVGLAGDMGVPWLLSRIVGTSRAKEISFLDKKVVAEEALQIGLVSQVFNADNFELEVNKLASRLAHGPQLATRALKSHYLSAERMGFEDFIDLEFQRHFHLAATDDFKEGWQALVERRLPVFSAYRESSNNQIIANQSNLNDEATTKEIL